MKRDSFIFYRSFYEGIKELPIDIQGEVLTAIMEYGLNGEITENLKQVAKAIFTLIKPQIDANNKRFENGSKGGRPPKKETEPEPNVNQNETKPEPKAENPKPNVNDNGNVNANVNANVNLNVNKNKGSVSEESDAYFIKLFNETKGTKENPTKYQLNNKVKSQLKARIKDGYTSKNFIKAIENCKKDDYHKNTGLKFLTPEFITRPEKLEIYLNSKEPEVNKPYHIPVDIGKLERF